MKTAREYLALATEECRGANHYTDNAPCPGCIEAAITQAVREKPVVTKWTTWNEKTREPALAQARKEELEACARIVEESYPCSCDEGYTGRGLTDPACFHCVPLAEAANEIRSRS